MDQARGRPRRDSAPGETKSSKKKYPKTGREKTHPVALAEPGDGGRSRGQQRRRGPGCVYLGPDGRGEASGVGLNGGGSGEEEPDDDDDDDDDDDEMRERKKVGVQRKETNERKEKK